MKRLLAICLLFAFALQTFQQAFLVLNYRLNTEIYAQNCENKARPVLRCKGKCQLMKKLQAEEQQKEKHPELKAENRVEVLCASFTLLLLPPPITPVPACLYAYADGRAIAGPSYPIFHPPALA